MTTKSSNSFDDDAVVINRDDISNYNPEQILPESPEVIKAIRKWLSPTNYAHESGEFRKHLASHMSGTGNWLTSSNLFNEWLNSPTNGMVWIKGIPGSGKSVVAAHLVHLLTQSNPGSPVLYFFFRQIIDANHSPAAMLCDWIDQVLQYSPPLQKELKELVDTRRSLSSLSLDDLWDYLRLALSGLPGKAFCVADALDEMDRDNNGFIQSLASLGEWKPSKVKVLITSRPVPGVEEPLRKARTLRMRLEEKMVDKDIASYVERGLATSSLSQTEQDLIRDAIPGHANGIFLYAKLAMDAFLEPGARTEDVLCTLPADLHAMYTRLLHEHAVRSGVPRDIQLLILQWVTHATRPLRLLELAEMVRVTCQQNARSETVQDIKSAKDLVRAAVGPLLEILPNETVCVIHHSFTEYLKCMTRLETDGGYPILRFGSTHARLGLACLVYLQAGCLDDIVVKKAEEYDLNNYNDREALYGSARRGKYCWSKNEIKEEEQRTQFQYPFFAYAMANWHLHVKRSQDAGSPQAKISAAIQEFLRDDHRVRAWIKLQWTEHKDGSTGVTPLHIGARYGLTEFARMLISQQVEVNAVDVFGKSPLWWAAKSGHADVIRLLVEAGADPDLDEKVSGLKPLHKAASENHADAVQALLQAGVDPLTKKMRENPGRRCGNAPRSMGHTPLMYACNNGHLEALKAFLPFLTDIDTVHRALAWSAAHGRSKLVKRILEHPDVDVNAKVRGDTALYLACDAVDRDSIVSLLEAEADPTIICSNARDEFSGIGSSFYGHLGISQQDITRGFTAMYAFCNLGRRGPRREKLPPEMIQEVFDLLIAKGASINQRTGDGSTLLHVAVNNPVLTRLLLRAGADPNATDEKGCVPLHSVTYPDSVDLLVEEGQADINAVRPSDGRTPLLCGLGQYDKDVIIKLIAYGPDLSIKDIKGNGPLHVALTQTSTSRTILEALLSAGADPNKRNHDGQTPLLLLRSKLGLMVDVLLKYGADINAKDFAGRTLLCHIMGERMSSDHSDIEALIAKGADPSVSDYKGKTLLHHAVARDDRLHHAMKPRKTATRFDFALSLGLDCQSLDYNGNTLLHEVVLRPGILQSQYTSQHIVLLEQLLALGIDINQGNHRGRTVLHMLAAIPSSNNGSVAEKPGYHDELDLVIGKIKDIDQRDQQGLTALHLASTVSVNLTKRLLDTGADPSVASLDGLTPLHLAARARQSNTVGLLLEANKVQGTSLVNAVDAKGNTPLYYACRSGMGETVRLLLDAGADASSKSLFLACAEFEEEQNLWSQERHVADVQANQGATGLTIEDRTRPSFGVNIHRGYKEIDAFRDLPRIEEILDMLIEHGCHPPGLHSALSKAIEAGFDYTIGCIRRVRDRHHNDEDKKATGDVLNVFDETTSKALERAHIDVATNPSILHSEKANRDLVVRLLKKRQYYTMQPLFDAGVNFVALGGRRYLKSKNLDLFVSHGYVSLLDTIGTLEAKRRLDEGKWHAYGDKSMPGLYSDVDVQDLKPRDMSQDVILIKALHRETPNMDVVRLLVEKFHVDVNQSLYTMHPTNDAKSELVPSETPLHYLAHGYHWWHVALALPYLISKGANLNAKDHTGSTPLHIALGGPGRYFGLFHKEAARFLVLAGADVNAVDGEGQSCLASAASHLSMVQLLLEHRVLINASALFVAIDAKNVDVLKALLKAGADPNNRMDVQPKSPEAKVNSWRQGFPTALYERVPIQEVYPLYSAAVKHGGRDYWLYADEKTSATVVQLVEALLAAGADPYATFTRKNPNYREENDGKDLEDEAVRGLLSNNSLSTEKSQTVTIIHDLLETNDLVHPILLLPSLDANRRDAQGRTLLHVACHAHDLNSPIDSVFKKRQETFSSSLPSFWTCLTARGADALATDSSSRNVLHHMFLNNERGASSDEEISLLKQILVQWPSLINQADTHGKTPLHVAMKHAVLRCDVRPADALLHAGADPGKVTHDGDTCLHFLAFRIYGSAAVRALFARLFMRGLDINARNKRGETPIFNLNKNLHNVAMEVKPNERITAAEALSLFENAGADLFARDGLARGLLHVAAKEMVVDEYAQFDEDDEEYSARSPIEPCVMRFQVLVQRGLDPMVEDGRKRTAVDVAAAFGKESVLRLFDKDMESVVGGQRVVRKTVK